MLVVAVHALDLYWPTGPVETFLFSGYLWVDLFLALSGYVLAERYADSFRMRPLWPVAADFLTRRFARLWPLLAITTLLLLAARQYGVASNGPMGSWGRALAANLFMVNAVTEHESINPPGWSVSAEWICCLAFPLLQAALLRRRRWPCVLAVALALATLAAMGYATLPIPLRRGPLDIALHPAVLPAWRCMCSFVLGMVAWRAARSGGLARLAGLPAIDLGLAAAILLLMSHRGTDLALVALFPLFIICVGHQAGPVARVLASRPVHALGVISYAIYLVHVPLLITGPMAFCFRLQARLAHYHMLQGKIALLAIFYVVVLPAATLAWWLVERPSRRALQAGFARLVRSGSGRTRPIASSRSPAEPMSRISGLGR